MKLNKTNKAKTQTTHLWWNCFHIQVCPKNYLRFIIWGQAELLNLHCGNKKHSYVTYIFIFNNLNPFVSSG